MKKLYPIDQEFICHQVSCSSVSKESALKSKAPKFTLMIDEDESTAMQEELRVAQLETTIEELKAQLEREQLLLQK